MHNDDCRGDRSDSRSDDRSDNHSGKRYEGYRGHDGTDAAKSEFRLGMRYILT